MTPANNAPFTWEEIEDQVRTAIFCQFLSLQTYGPSDKALYDLFLGIDTDLIDSDIQLGSEQDSEALRSFPVERHFLAKMARDAYVYAYQCDGWTRVTGEAFHAAIFAVVGSYVSTDPDGEHSPLSPLNDPPLRRVLETFIARWKLSNEHYHSGLTVRELALLSNMTVPAVRTSLSKEGFKLELTHRANARKDENGELKEEDAIIWLSRRRGFVPTREDDAGSSSAITAAAALDLWLETLPFDVALRKAFLARGTDFANLEEDFDINTPWLKNLAEGKNAPWLKNLAEEKNAIVDITMLRKLAVYLDTNEAVFTAKGVQHLIQLELLGANGGIA